MEAQKQVQKEAQAVSSVREKKVGKTGRLWVRRQQKGGILKWREYMLTERRKEQRARALLLRTRTNYIKQAFARYKDYTEYLVQAGYNEKRTEVFISTHNLRSQRRQFYAWAAYIHTNRERNVQLKRKLKWMLDNKRRRHITRWFDNSKHCEGLALLEKYQATGEEIAERNQELAHFQNQDDFQLQEYKVTEEDQLSKARRQLKNYIVRLYTLNLERGFKAWHTVHVRHQTRDERLKRILMHHKRKLFGQITVMFKAHAATARTGEKKEVIFSTTMLGDEQANLIQKEEYEFTKKANAIRARIEVRSSHPSNISKKKASFEMQEEKLNKALNMIYLKNERNFFVVKKRSVFHEWRKYIRFQRGFLHAIANFAYKGMYMKGLLAIREEAKV